MRNYLPFFRQKRSTDPSIVTTETRMFCKYYGLIKGGGIHNVRGKGKGGVGRGSRSTGSEGTLIAATRYLKKSTLLLLLVPTHTTRARFRDWQGRELLQLREPCRLSSFAGAHSLKVSQAGSITVVGGRCSARQCDACLRVLRVRIMQIIHP